MGTIRKDRNGAWFMDYVDATGRRRREVVGYSPRTSHRRSHSSAKAIQARMGHASITTTLNTYGHLMPSAFQGVGEKLDRVLSPAGTPVADKRSTAAT